MWATEEPLKLTAFHTMFMGCYISAFKLHKIEQHTNNGNDFVLVNNKVGKNPFFESQF
jgi:hypothetical protein